MGKQVKKPRFYVDIPTFLHATGQMDWDSTPRGGAELLYINASNPFKRTDSDLTVFSIGHPNNNPPKTSFPINFCGLINHNFASDSNPVKIQGKHGLSSEQSNDRRTLHGTNVLNTDCTDNDLGEEYNGTSICTFDTMDEYWRSFEVYFGNGINLDLNHQLGSFVVGKYWDAPNSPDLSLTMSRRFEGIKTKKTMGGKILSNIYYDGPTEWTMNTLDDIYKYPPFELASTDSDFDKKPKSGLGRKGLRSWNLTFSYISENNMWMDNEVSNTIISDSTNFSKTNSNPMLTDDSFNFVWNCTLGGTLPFIFQPDNTNNNPDQFSICTFNQKTLSVQQVAYNTYTLSITIDEVA